MAFPGAPYLHKASSSFNVGDRSLVVSLERMFVSKASISRASAAVLLMMLVDDVSDSVDVIVMMAMLLRNMLLSATLRRCSRMPLSSFPSPPSSSIAWNFWYEAIEFDVGLSTLPPIIVVQRWTRGEGTVVTKPSHRKVAGLPTITATSVSAATHGTDNDMLLPPSVWRIVDRSMPRGSTMLEIYLLPSRRHRHSSPLDA